MLWYGKYDELASKSSVDIKQDRCTDLQYSHCLNAIPFQAAMNSRPEATHMQQMDQAKTNLIDHYKPWYI